MYFVNFFCYISSMKIVKRKINKKLLHRHVMFGDIADNSKTYASAIMLHRYYRSIEIKEDHTGNDWRYLFITKRTFLRHHRNENGNWTCHYCRKELTEMPKRGQHWQNWKKVITIDHKKPACECENKLDSKNFLPACSQCNKDKGSMSYEKFTSKNFTKPKFSLPREHDLKTIFCEKP